MERRSDTVSREVPHHSITKSGGVCLNGFANHVNLASRRDRFDTTPECFFGALHQQRRRFGGLTDHESFVEISVHTVFESRDVDIDNVTLVDDGVIGDAMADHFIQRGAA